MAPVIEFDDEVRRIIADMTETMYAEPGVGLAAAQVGIDRRIIVYDVSGPDTPPQPQALINPEIVEASGERRDFDGCLSFPGLYGETTRPHYLRVVGLDEDGNPFDRVFEGFNAVIIHHEMDHLDFDSKCSSDAIL
mgnify:CR=1 FL=1